MLSQVLSQIFPLLIVFSMIIGARTTSAMDRKMQQVHHSIAQDYENVDHLTVEQFNKLESEHTVIFDVRELAEFNVSHITNAIQIDPDIETQQFIETYAEEYQDKTIVFYCSVGRRSSELANRIDEALNQAEFAEIYNLTGGVFEWHNNKLPLVNENGLTELIHPYNQDWSKLILEKDDISY